VRGFEEVFTFLAEVLRPSLRSLEQCVAQACIALLSLQNKEYKFQHLLAFLILLRAQKADVYRRYMSGEITGIQTLNLAFGEQKQILTRRKSRLTGLLEYHLVTAMNDVSLREQLIDDYSTRSFSADDEHGQRIKGLLGSEPGYDAPDHNWIVRTMEYVGAFNEQPTQ
jgi:hypothetical protein